MSTVHTLSSYHRVCTEIHLHHRTFQWDDIRLPYQRVHLGGLHLPQFFYRVLDLTFIRLDINKKHECIMFLDLLHRRFGIQGATNQK